MREEPVSRRVRQPGQAAVGLILDPHQLLGEVLVAASRRMAQEELEDVEVVVDESEEVVGAAD